MKQTEYTLRLPKPHLKEMPLAVVGDFFKEFIGLLGKKNTVCAITITSGSACFVGTIEESKEAEIEKRLNMDCESYKKYANKIEKLLQKNHYTTAEIQKDGLTIRIIEANPNNDFLRIKQKASIDGIVTGVEGADDTMHITLRDDESDALFHFMTNDILLAQKLAGHLRGERLRFNLDGAWIRHPEKGWIPDARSCKLESFEILKKDSTAKILDKIKALPQNGWRNAQPNDWREYRYDNEAKVG